MVKDSTKVGFLPFLFIVFFLTTAQVGIPKWEHDFGVMKAGSEASYVFEIENSEPDPLVVEYVESG